MKSTTPKHKVSHTIDVIHSSSGYDNLKQEDDEEHVELMEIPRPYEAKVEEQEENEEFVLQEFQPVIVKNGDDEVVHNDIRAVHPEELEEVRKHGVAASLRKQWETSMANGSSGTRESVEDETKQVTHGAAKNLRKMFEQSQSTANLSTPPPAKTGSKWRCKTPEPESAHANGAEVKSQPKWNVLDPREVSKRLSHTPRQISEDQNSANSGSSDAIDSGVASRGEHENENGGKTVFENTPVVRDDTVRSNEDSTLSELEQLRQSSATRNVRNVFQQMMVSSSTNSSPSKTSQMTPKKLNMPKFQPRDEDEAAPVSSSNSDASEEAPKPAPGTARSMAQLFNGNRQQQHHQQQQQQAKSQQFRWRVDDPRERSRQLKQADVRSGEMISNEEMCKPSLVVIQSQK